MRRKFVVDHMGYKFRSVKEMCEYHGVLESVYYDRIKRGFDLKSCLSPVDLKETSCEDHEGNKFSSISAMCAYHGINRTTYLARRAKGYDVKLSLTGEGIEGHNFGCKYNECEDHEGNKFRSTEAMCSYHGVNRSTYLSRRANGYDIRSSLTGEGIEGYPITNSKECEDHKGKKFPSVKAMCEHYGVTSYSYYTRLNRGLSLEECLRSDNLGAKACTDHLGNKFTSLKAMCKYHGVNTSVYIRRKNKGLSLEECLSKDDGRKSVSLK